VLRNENAHFASYTDSTEVHLDLVQMVFMKFLFEKKNNSTHSLFAQ